MLEYEIICPYCNSIYENSIDSICDESMFKLVCEDCGKEFKVYVEYDPTFEISKCDLFYKFCKDQKTGEEYWLEAEGEKIVMDGEDFFLLCGCYTHGKSGVLSLREDMEDSKKQEIIKLMKDFDKHELSPLYNDNCKINIRSE